MHNKQIVYIHWKDAMHSMSQHSVASLGTLADLHEIGFLVKETAETITIGTESEEQDAGEVRMWLTVPKASIVDIRRTTLARAFPPPRAKKATPAPPPDPDGNK